MIHLITDTALLVQVKAIVTTIMTALEFLIPVVVALFIITKALGERAEIKMLIGEGILAVIGLELLFIFAKSLLG